MTFYPEVQRLKPQIQYKRRYRTHLRAQVAHKLRPGFHDVGRFAELLGVGYTVVRFVRLGKLRIFSACPVEISAVHNCTANTGCVTIHIFGGGMRYNVCAKFKGAAVDGRCKRVVDNKRNAVAVGQTRKPFNI